MRTASLMAAAFALSACVTTDAGTGRTPPVQRPQENIRSVENTLERLRQQQSQQQRPSGGSPSTTAPLTEGEARALAAQIGQCWGVDAGILSLQDIVVELRVQLDGQGNVRNVVPSDRGVPSDPRARAVYESARRALLSPQCNPLRVPPDRHRAVMETTFRFSPRGLVGGAAPNSALLPAGATQRPAIAAAEVCRARGLTGSAYADCFDAELAARNPIASTSRADTSDPDFIDRQARRSCWGFAQPSEIESFDACVRRRTAELNAAARSPSANSARTAPTGVMPRQDPRPGPAQETSRPGSVPPTHLSPSPEASTTPGAVPLRWEIERRSEHCMMHAVNGLTRISLIARRGEINLFWYEPRRPTMTIHSLQRLRFEGGDAIWTVEGEAMNERTIVFRGGRDTFAVRRISDVLGGGMLATTEAQPVRVTLPPAGRLTVEFLHCIDSLGPQQERPSPPRTPQQEI